MAGAPIMTTDLRQRPMLLSVVGVSRQFGARPLFADLSLAVYEGDRIGLVGPNGSGKSSLLRILAGLDPADHGTRSLRKGVSVAFVPQDPELAPERTVSETVRAALADLRLDALEEDSRVAIALGRMGFRDGAAERAGGTQIGRDDRVATLSGGWRKRLAIAAALARQSDVLLLDEPTNHLDLEGILELEALLANPPFAFVVVSHDRYFLENVARRMVEIDRAYADGLLVLDGRYSDLVERRDEVRRAQAEYQATLANRARNELAWLRRGAKARTTKAKARIDQAHELFAELADLRERSRSTGSAAIDFADSGRQTKRLLVAEGVGKSFAGRRVLAGIDLLLRPGTKLGVLGPNGSGKSTLLALLAGKQEPDEGTIERAPFLKTVVFEQSRQSLDKSVTLRRALAPEGDAVIHLGRSVHVASWAQRFLFRTEQLETPVGRLSGGEQARILLARLMLEPADLLILDEPTNDLDIPTLEVLEETLLEFPGALVLVTHDRYLLDRVATTVLALDPDAAPGAPTASYFADTTQWEEAQSERRRRGSPSPPAGRSPASPAAGPAPVPPLPAKKRLSWREQQEWEQMEATILAAEEALAAAQAAVEDPAAATDAQLLHARYLALDGARSDVERLYARWAELEAKRG
jgi:ATP-binding cassette subfamily F protein uup